MRNQIVQIGLCSIDTILMGNLADYLLECHVTQRCVVFQKGKRLLRELESGVQYDGILLDMMQQDMDVLEFLLRLRALHLHKRPIIFLLTMPEVFARTQQKLQAMVDCCLYKPVHPEMLARQIHLFCDRKLAEENKQPNMSIRLWGVTLEPAQERYCITAVRILSQSGRQMALRKELFPMVAKRYGVSIAAVDSGLRRMIQSLEERNTPEYQSFKQVHGLGDRRPTVKQMLYACCDLREFLGTEET